MLKFNEPLPDVGDSFWYLASPYSKHPKGIEYAHSQACKAAAILIKYKVPVFCPIAHSHSISIEGGAPKTDHDFWLPADKPLMDQAAGIIVLKLESWENSVGVQFEIEEFTKAGKPVRYLEWE